MGKRLNINPGDRFSRLTIIKEVKQINSRRYFLCECDCGAETEVSLIQLRTGKTKSCGCYRRDKLRQLYSVHGDSRKKLYMIWCTMKARCLRANSERFKYYGGRGIKVCDEWLEYLPFKNWAMTNGYKEGLTLERVNVNGDYCPQNCKWIPKSEQPKNSRSNIIVTIQGEENYFQYWADKFNINRTTVQSRLQRGWSVEDAFQTPPGGQIKCK